ncbi:MAG: hypothetical protein ACKOE6_09710 [Flammeovirgaceae bacterium]
MKQTVKFKMTWYKILFIVLMLVACEAAKSQNIATTSLVWQVDELTDLSTNKTLPFQASFITKAGQTVEWIQKKGEKNSSYTITATQGQWLNIAQAGMVTYMLQRNGVNWRMVLEKTPLATFIYLDFSGGSEPVRQRFRVTNVEPAN